MQSNRLGGDLCALIAPSVFGGESNQAFAGGQELQPLVVKSSSNMAPAKIGSHCVAGVDVAEHRPLIRKLFLDLVIAQNRNVDR
jgi:hypothetical protein